MTDTADTRSDEPVQRLEFHVSWDAAIGGNMKITQLEHGYKGFNAGLELAARIAEDWADQCGGGSGSGGEGYRNLASAFRGQFK